MNYLIQGLLIAAFILIEVLIGGTRLLFSLPSYCLIAIAACISALALRRPLMPARPACLWSAGIFAAYLLARIAFSPVEYLARPDLFSVVGSLMVFLLVALVLTAPKHRQSLLVVMFVIALAHVIIGIVQFTRGENFMPISFLQRANYGVRASGFYICPNHLAGFLEVVTVFALSMACWSRRSVGMKVVFAYVALVCLAGMVITGSRGGYLSILAGLAVFVVLSVLGVRSAGAQRLWLAVALIAVSGALLAGGVAWFVSRQPAVQARVDSVFDMRNDRLELWRAALEQTKLDPVFGTGSGTYLYYGRKFRAARITHDPVHVHNDYLHLLAEYGAVGVAVFVIFLVTHLAAGWRTFRWLVSERALALGRLQSDALALNIGALCAAATFAAHSVVDFNMHIPANALLMAFVFGMLANPGVTTAREARGATFASWAGRCALPILSVFVLLFGARLLPGEHYAEKARVALRDGQHFWAIHFAKLALEQETKNPDIYRHLGEASAAVADAALTERTRTEYREAARQAFASGLELFPQDRWALLQMGFLLDDQREFEEGDTFFRQAVEWDPNSAQVHAYYGRHLLLWGKLDEAERAYQKSQELWKTRAAEAGLQAIAAARAKGEGAEQQPENLDRTNF